MSFQDLMELPAYESPQQLKRFDAFNQDCADQDLIVSPNPYGLGPLVLPQSHESVSYQSANWNNDPDLVEANRNYASQALAELNDTTQKSGPLNLAPSTMMDIREAGSYRGASPLLIMSAKSNQDAHAYEVAHQDIAFQGLYNDVGIAVDEDLQSFDQSLIAMVDDQDENIIDDSLEHFRNTPRKIQMTPKQLKLDLPKQKTTLNSMLKTSRNYPSGHANPPLLKSFEPIMPLTQRNLARKTMSPQKSKSKSGKKKKEKIVPPLMQIPTHPDIQHVTRENFDSFPSSRLLPYNYDNFASGRFSVSLSTCNRSNQFSLARLSHLQDARLFSSKPNVKSRSSNLLAPVPRLRFATNNYQLNNQEQEEHQMRGPQYTQHSKPLQYNELIASQSQQQLDQQPVRQMQPSSTQKMLGFPQQQSYQPSKNISKSAMKPSQQRYINSQSLAQIAEAFDRKINGQLAQNKAQENYVRKNRQEACQAPEQKFKASGIVQKFLQECKSNQKFFKGNQDRQASDLDGPDDEFDDQDIFSGFQADVYANDQVPMRRFGPNSTSTSRLGAYPGSRNDRSGPRIEVGVADAPSQDQQAFSTNIQKLHEHFQDKTRQYLQFQSQSVMRGEPRYASMSVMSTGNNHKNRSQMAYPRESLYDRAMKRNELKKLNEQAQKEQEDREVAACSFAPNLNRSTMSYRGAYSPERRPFDQFYTAMLKPMTSLEKKRQLAPKIEKEKMKEYQKQFQNEQTERRQLYDKLHNQYQENIQQLEDGETFRKPPEIYQPSFKPRINNPTEKLMARNRSTGNVSSSLYDEHRLRSSRRSQAEKEQALSIARVSNISQIHRSAQIGGGQISNSDRYFAQKLCREFAATCEELEVSEELDKSQLFEICVRLGYLKPVQLLTSEFLAKENIDIFEKMCDRIATEKEQDVFPQSAARTFFFALNYLYGDWIEPKKLFSRNNRPDKIKQANSPQKKTGLSFMEKSETSSVIQPFEQVKEAHGDEELLELRVNIEDAAQSRNQEEAEVQFSKRPTIGVRAENNIVDEPEEDQVASDEEGLVQAPKDDRKDKGFKVETEKQCRFIISQFKVMCVNRKNLMQMNEKTRLKEIAENKAKQSKEAAHPEITEKTKKLAQRNRQRSAHPAMSRGIQGIPEVDDENENDETLNHGKQAKVYNRLYAMRHDVADRKKKLMEMKEEPGLEECNFTPNVDRQRKRRFGNTEEKGRPIHERLFACGLESRQYEGRTQEEVEFEQQKDLLTFRPDIDRRYSSKKKTIVPTAAAQRNSTSYAKVNDQVIADDENMRSPQRKKTGAVPSNSALRHQSRLVREKQKAEEEKHTQSKKAKRVARPSSSFGKAKRKSTHVPSAGRLTKPQDSAVPRQQVLEAQVALDATAESSEQPNMTQELDAADRTNIADVSQRLFEEQPKLNKTSADQDLSLERSPLRESLRSASPAREAILFLDVNLGKGKSARIVIYEGDKPADVIEVFSAEHSLNEKKKSKLLDVINNQMSQILPPINEESYASPFGDEDSKPALEPEADKTADILGEIKEETKETATGETVDVVNTTSIVDVDQHIQSN